MSKAKFVTLKKKTKQKTLVGQLQNLITVYRYMQSSINIILLIMNVKATNATCF